MSTNIGLAVGAFVVGVVLWILTGMPLWLIVAALVGAITANRKRA